MSVTPAASHIFVPVRSSITCEGSPTLCAPINTKLHLAVDAHGMPVRVLITAGPVADCAQANGLIEGLSAEHLIADKGYDSDAIVEQAKRQGMQAQIPPRKNRKEPRVWDKDIYKLRHLAENAFRDLKEWRGIATRSYSYDEVQGSPS
jgi:transposase